MVALFKNVDQNQMKGFFEIPLYCILSLSVFLFENYAEIIGTGCLAISTFYLVLNNRKGVRLKEADIQKTKLESELLRIQIEEAKEND